MGQGRLEATSPERLTELAGNAQAASAVIERQPSYLRTVRLVKQMRDHHIGRGEEKPGGRAFELLTYWAFASGATASSYAELLAPVLSSVAAQLTSGRLIEPSMNQPYAPAPDPAALAKAASIFAALAADARRALIEEDCAAAAIWRRMLGENEKVGWVFPLPPGCTELGTTIAGAAEPRPWLERRP